MGKKLKEEVEFTIGCTDSDLADRLEITEFSGSAVVQAKNAEDLMCAVMILVEDRWDYDDDLLLRYKLLLDCANLKITLLS